MLKRIVVGFLVYFAHVFAVKKLNDTGVTDLATIVKPEFKFKKPMLPTKELYKQINTLLIADNFDKQKFDSLKNIFKLSNIKTAYYFIENINEKFINEYQKEKSSLISEKIAFRFLRLLELFPEDQNKTILNKIVLLNKNNAKLIENLNK